MMKLYCQYCGTESVSFTSHQKWRNTGTGEIQDFVTGVCDRCDSVELSAPSDNAVEIARTRVTAMKRAMRAVRGE